MSKPWWHFIKDKESYDTLVSTGMAWELMADLPLTWEECQEKFQHLQNLKLEMEDKID